MYAAKGMAMLPHDLNMPILFKLDSCKHLLLLRIKDEDLIPKKKKEFYSNLFALRVPGLLPKSRM